MLFVFFLTFFLENVVFRKKTKDDEKNHEKNERLTLTRSPKTPLKRLHHIKTPKLKQLKEVIIGLPFQPALSDLWFSQNSMSLLAQI